MIGFLFGLTACIAAAVYAPDKFSALIAQIRKVTHRG